MLSVEAVPGFVGRTAGRSGAHLPELMGLRGVAILMVVCGHLLQRIPRFSGDSIPEGPFEQHLFWLLATPYNGCCILLAVSGYSLMLLLHPRTRTVGSFRIAVYIARRLSRFYPPYCLILLVTFAFITLTAYVPSKTNFFFGEPKSLSVSLAASLLLVHDLAFGTFPRLFPPGWFVESQMQFYLIGPGLWLLYLRLSNDVVRLVVGFVLLVVFAEVSLVLWWDGPANLRYSIIAVMPYLWTGALVADLRFCRKTAWLGRVMRYPGPIGWAGVFGIVIFGAPDDYPALRLACQLLCLAAVIYTAFENGGFQRALVNRWLMRLGVACYSIYLVHLQISQVLSSVIVGAIDHLPVLLIVLLCAAVELPVIMGVAAVFYWLVERPWVVARGLIRI